MSRLKRLCWPPIAGAMVLLAAVNFAQSASADPAAPGGVPPAISVIGSGWSSGKPSVVEIDATLTGEAELTADALVKYRDTRQRAVSALEALKITGFTVESAGYSVGQAADPNAQQMAMRGMAVNNTGAAKVAVTELLKLKITGADNLEAGQVMDQVIRVLDAARDAGLVVGQQLTPYQYQTGQQSTGIVKFKIPDRSVIRDKAYEAALADARKKAEKLAELSGVKLGQIRSVRESAVNENNSGPPVGEDSGAGELSSDKFANIDMKVVLNVSFDIAGK